MSRIPILVVVPSFQAGGAERVTVTFANLLPRDRFEVHLVVYSPVGPLRTLLADHVEVHDLDAGRMWTILVRLIRLAWNLKPAAVIVSSPTTNVTLLGVRFLLPRQTRVLVREPNLPSLRLPTMRRRRAVAFGYRRLYPRADVVLATSERMRRELVDLGASAERVEVLPNPVDVDRIRRAADRPTRVDGSGRRLLAVGRLVEQKGFGDLIEVVAALDRSDHLTILGEGTSRAQLEARIRDLGLGERVAMPGFSDNPWAWMAGADVLLLPSRTEGMPNVVLEALTCGTPVIATPESGGIAELADESPPGAINVVPIERFPEALRSVRVLPTTGRENLLPARFHLEAAAGALSGMLLRSIGGEQPGGGRG